MNEQLRQELLAMREEDLRVRAELLKGASSFGSYHPRMEELHEQNTARLKEIIAEHGRPGRSLVGEDGAIAAWFITQHAISDPPFQRRALELLREAHSKVRSQRKRWHSVKTVSASSKAVRRSTGRSLSITNTVCLKPSPIADPEHVNETALSDRHEHH